MSGTVPTPNFRQTLLTAVPAYASCPGRRSASQPTFCVRSRCRPLHRFRRNRATPTTTSTARATFDLTNNSNLTLSYTHGRPYQSTPRIYSNNPQVYHGFIERGTANYITGGPSWTSETRFGYNLNDMDRTDRYFLDGIPETIPYRRQRSPQLSYTDLLRPAANCSLWRGRTWSLEAEIREIVGKHSFKVGGIYMRYNVFRTNPQNRHDKLCQSRRSPRQLTRANDLDVRKRTATTPRIIRWGSSPRTTGR